jgi:tryptophan synthase alpha chain
MKGMPSGAIAQQFASLRSKGEKALVLFVTAGDQPLAQLPDILSCLQEAGADLIEVGIPFSDPFGEGPTIQGSSQRSLDQGTTVYGVLEALSKVEKRVPHVTMGYYNNVLRLGLSEFAKLTAEAGSSGTIISDLVPDEAQSWIEASQAHGLDTIFLAAPTSTPQRLDEVAEFSTGFVYTVSRTGVTGAGQEAPPEVTDLVTAIKSRTDKPVCVGFGISKPEHVAMVCQVADGAVVGSALVDLLHREWQDGKGAARVAEFVRELKAATRP